jgi:hypothetical protein
MLVWMVSRGGRFAMRRQLLFLAVFATVGLMGCNRFVGPVESRQQKLGRVEVRPDGTRRSIDEQKIVGRERFAVSEDDYRIGPKGYIDRPSPIGR